MIKVGFSGVPGAGKTSTARSVAGAARSIDGLRKLELIPEYARDYIQRKGVMKHLWQQKKVMDLQIEAEDVIPFMTEILITDAPVHLGFIYALELSTGTREDAELMTDIFEKLMWINSPKPRYDLIFHIPPHLPPVDDGVRTSVQFDDKWRSEMDVRARMTFKIFPPGEFLIIDPSLSMADRVTFCLKALSDLVSKRKLGQGGAPIDEAVE